MKRPLRNIKKQLSKFPLPFWVSFYLLCVVMVLPLLAYLGTFSRGADSPPIVATQTAASVTQSTASLNGLTSPKGVTERGFEYGTTTSYGETVQDASIINYAFSAKWGSSGTGDGQFGTAYGVAVDSNDNVYISDISNNNIQKFDSNGNFITKWGSTGTGDGQFRGPYGIDIDSNDNVYIGENINDRIQKFDSNGNFITKWGSTGTGDGQFNGIQGLGVAADGTVYVADSGNNDRIQKFDSNGNFITKWGSTGTGDGQFNNPVNATVDSSGNVYVADFNNNRIQKFDSNGTFITKWVPGGGPYDLDVDSNGNIAVIEGGGDQVEKFDSNGNFINKWGTSGSGDGQFNVGVGIAINSNDDVYTSDFLVDRIQKFTGIITADISSLDCSTTYHYRAYATNSYGTSYGDDQSFTTELCPGDFNPVTFDQCGAQASWVVPDGVNQIAVEIAGAKGGGAYTEPGGGLGGRVETTLQVTSGQTLYLNPGCQGNTGVALQTSVGGWNGGGTGGRGAGSGGGASDIRTGGTALSDRVVVAGAGGGVGADISAGAGGGFGGIGGNVDGDSWQIANGAGEGGLGENSSDGGFAGNQVEGGYGGNGTSGSLGLGGDGGNSYLQTQSRGGGGGGGGYYGGGGGSTFIGDPGGGGGGGSSYANQAITSATTFSKGVNSGDGYISLTPVGDPFIFRVKTDIPASSGDTQFVVPVGPDYIYDYSVDCNNDGTPEFTGRTVATTCNYGVAGEYDIAISGTYPHMYNASTDAQKIIDVKQWGGIAWQDMRFMFFDADNLTSFSATDTPDLSSVLDMDSMFSGADQFNGNIESWDVGGVNDFSGLFQNATSFNQSLDNWDMSSAVDTSFMFEDTPFSQPLNNWDVSNVTNMSSMFQGANSFNQPLDNWDTGSVTDMSGMFYQNTGFNQDISSWNTSSVTSLLQMFVGATSFNQPLNSWDTSNVAFFQGVFFGASSFNQPLDNWDVSAGDSFQFMFASASAFDQDLSTWNTSNIANMSGMFTAASSYDQSLAGWDVSNVADMTYMFGDAGGLAPGTSGLSVANYDATLIAWSQQNLQSGVTFDAGTSQYCTAEAQRQSMIDLDAWTINDSGKNCEVLAELPSAPRNLRASGITTSSIRLDWDPPASDGGTEILAYQVQYRIAGSSTWINAPLQAATPTAHIFINLNSGTGYEFRVAAINAVGQGPFSGQVNATTLSVTITPTQPQNPTDPPVTPVNPEVPTTDGETNTPAPNSPTYSRPQSPVSTQQALPMKQSTLGAVMGPLINFVRPVPSPVARAIPWTILLLLIAIACLYAYSAYQEHRRRQALERLKQRFAATLAARATFLEISSHYIKTPITKIQGIIELLQSGVIGSASASSNKTVTALSAEVTTLTIPEDTIVTAQQAIRSMTEHANELLDEGQALTGRQQAKMQIIDKYSKLSILTRPGFWLPVLVVVTLTIMTNFIFIQADKYEANVITVVAQGLVGIVGIIAVAVSLYFLRASRIQSSVAKQQSEIEAEILTRQQKLIEGAVSKFDDDLMVLGGLSSSIRRYPKTEAYSDGLEEFQKIVNQFKKLDELSRIVPGIAWSVPLAKTINSVVSTLGALGEQRGVTVRANLSDKVTNVAVSQEALMHLIAAPLKNALLASARGSSVEITVSKRNKEAEVTIRDTGPGIPADKLASIFDPFNSATDTKRFSNTGLGLDLYLVKVITEQYGCYIKLESTIGEGTVVKILLPVSGHGESAA